VRETEADVVSEAAGIVPASTAPGQAADKAQPAPAGPIADQADQAEQQDQADLQDQAEQQDQGDLRDAAQETPLTDLQQAESAGQGPDTSTEILQTLQELADTSKRYHVRAEQREGVIDHLRSEVDRLRRGERRGLLRPLLVEICRLRNDLLRQADDLPPDFDAERARVLIRSYAESVELALEDNGVVTYAPEEGTIFEPRMQRRVGGEPTSDPAAVGRVARVRRHGYLDIEANTAIAPAEVVVFSAPATDPAPATDERNEP
jgi:molecular chaperone GrpE (heat shock protein)